jgi:iron complex outermembrane receptor protein
MKKQPTFKFNAVSRLVSVALMTLVSSQMAAAQTAAVDLGTIGASTAAGAFRTNEALKGTATAVAPTQASLEASQPQSIITREFMDLSVTPIAEYTRIVNIAPSMSGDAKNGPGLSETKTIMRGFGDDQYNITFDGIPWGDTNNPAHHSTSFFPSAVIGGVVVERGPGNASNLGYATFGGSINLFSKKPSAEENTTVYTSMGTWNTQLYGFSYETGRMANRGDATLQLNYQKLTSDGALSSSSIKNENYTAKYERPVGDSSLLTMYGTINKIVYNEPDKANGVTKFQEAQFGKYFQLNNDPSSMNFKGFNQTSKGTDFGYLRLRSELNDGWSTDNALYTYSYDNRTKSSMDPTWTGWTSGPQTFYGTPLTVLDPRRTTGGSSIRPAGTFASANTTPSSNVTVNGNIPGYDKLNQYDVYGNIFKATKKLENGLLRAGIWYETSNTNRHQYDLDMTTGAYNQIEKQAFTGNLPGTDRPLNSVQFDQQSRIESTQTFAEFEWAVSPKTTITPGLKFVNIHRSEFAAVELFADKTRGQNHSSSSDYKKTLPFLTVNYKLDAQTSVYGQYAQGFQIPDLKTLYVQDVNKNNVAPQTSLNFQLGMVGKSDTMTWDVDVYQINFENKLVADGTKSFYTNIGGATYKGIEGQMANILGGGFALYTNGSINVAEANDTGKQLASAPTYTAALGGLYSDGPWSGSLMLKRVGTVYQQEFAAGATGQADYDYYKSSAYNNLDLGVAYAFKNPTSYSKKATLQFNVFNMLNSQKVTAITTPLVNKDRAFDTYLYQAPRSMMVTLKADL